MRRALVSDLVLAGSLLALPLTAQAPPFSDELQVNTYTTGDQDFPAVAVGRDGQFLAVWRSQGQDGSESGIFAQLYGSDGEKIGSEFGVNTYTTGLQDIPEVAASGTGDFVVTWASLDGGDLGIFARRIQAGAPVGIDFPVNTYTPGTELSPAVAMGPDSSFVIVWSTSAPGTPGRHGIFGRRSGPSLGSPLGPEFQIGGGMTSGAASPSVAMDPLGNFVVVWDDYENGSERGIMGQRFGPTGDKIGSAFPVNSNTTGTQNHARVAMSDRSAFVVVWTDYGGEDGDAAGIFGQLFNASAEKVGPEFQVNTHTTGSQVTPSVAMDSHGGFVATWLNGDFDHGAQAVAGQRFDREATKVGTEFSIDASGHEIVSPEPRISSGNTDGFVVVWANVGGDGDGQGVFRRRTDLLPQPMRVDVHGSAGAPSDSNGVLEPGESVGIEAAWRNAGASPLSRVGTASDFTGPGGVGLYHLLDTAADYGSIPTGAAANCHDATVLHDCYGASLEAPAARPATHWDTSFREDLSGNGTQLWKVHVGDSFDDVSRSQPFYAKIETILHFGITSGCSETSYCPGDTVSRDQMAIFIAKAIAGSGELVPTAGELAGAGYDCAPGGSSLFTDVAPGDEACRHIHYLAQQNVTLGCGPGQYCPGPSVTRDAMAAFIAKAVLAPRGGAAVPESFDNPTLGRSYSCNAGSPNTHFADVLASNPFCKHVHFLWASGVLDGCAATEYCPSGPVTRDAMAKFIAKAFGMELYGP